MLSTPAADEDFARIHPNRAGGDMHRGHRGAAEAVDGRGPQRLRQPGHHADETGDVEALLALRKGAAEQQILDIFGRSAGFGHQGADHLSRHFIGTDGSQFPLFGERERRARISGDNHLLHQHYSSHCELRFDPNSGTVARFNDEIGGSRVRALEKVARGAVGVPDIPEPMERGPFEGRSKRCKIRCIYSIEPRSIPGVMEISFIFERAPAAAETTASIWHDPPWSKPTQFTSRTIAAN